jgi:integrase
MAVHLRKRKLKSGAFRAYLDLYHNGRRWYEFPENLIYTKETKRETLDLAEKLVARRQLELAHNETGFTPSHKRKANFVELFKEIKEKKSPETQRSWNAALLYLDQFTGGRLPFSALNHLWLEEFQSYLLERIGQNTANLYLTKVKAVIKEAVKNRIFATDPTDRFSFSKSTDSAKVYLSSEEIEKLLLTESPNPEVKRAFLFSCFTGLRLSDVETLTWDMIKTDDTGTKLHFRQMKTKGFEYIPLNDSAILFLNGSNDGKTIPFTRGKVFDLPTRTTIRHCLTKMVKKAGIDKAISFHCGRHTYATLSLSNGVPMSTVQRLLGHRDSKSTAVYAKVTDQAMNEAVKRIPNIKAAG